MSRNEFYVFEQEITQRNRQVGQVGREFTQLVCHAKKAPHISYIFGGRHVYDGIDFIGICTNAVLVYDMTPELHGTFTKFTLVTQR